jgi:hypothetical protein
VQFMEHSARRTKCPIFCVSSNLRQKAMLHGVALQRVQERRKALFSATATFLHSLVTLGKADSQQKVIKGHAPNGDLETALWVGEHKGMGFTGLFSRALLLLHQILRPGCIFAPLNPVWDARFFGFSGVRKHPLPFLSNSIEGVPPGSAGFPTRRSGRIAGLAASVCASCSRTDAVA